jgi:hypothetical protein
MVLVVVDHRLSTGIMSRLEGGASGGLKSAAGTRWQARPRPLYSAPVRIEIPSGTVMLIATAHAQAGGAPAAFDFVSLMPLVLIFVVFYFLLIRPQQKKMKQHREMIAALKRGDKVLTSGGIIGTIVKV